MKVIFLDIDGVLNSQRYYERRKLTRKDGREYEIDDRAVAILNRLIERTGAKVVISSTWRLSGVAFVEDCLRKRGFVGEIIGATPVGEMMNGLIMARGRGNEIGQWLVEHPEVESWVILDDDSDMGTLLRFLVLTDAYDSGLTEECANRAARILESAPNRVAAA